MVLSLLPTVVQPAAAAADGSGITGSGTEGSPYIITSADQLAYVAQQVNAGTYGWGSANYKLGNDINLAAYPNWTPIGKLDFEFNGTFDGGGHIISNLKINTISSLGSSYGLFGEISGGTVKNVGLSGVSINVISAANSLFVGGLAGNTDGTIVNCVVAGSISGTVTHSSVYFGGIAGRTMNGTVENCYTTAAVSVTGAGTYSVGGLAGYNRKASISYSYWLSTATADSVGRSDSSASETGNCSFTGTDLLAAAVTVGGTNTSSLLDALNAWLNSEAKTDLYTWVSSGSYPVFGPLWTPPTYTATVTVNKDGGSFGAGAPTITLGTTVDNAVANGTSVANGTYNIYANGIDTGVNITVSGSAASVDLNYYTVTFKSQDGNTALDTQTVLSGQTAVYGGLTPEKAATAQYTYVFSNWVTAANGSSSATLENITAAKTVYASFTQTLQNYTIIWAKDAATTIDFSTVAYGGMPTHSDPTNTGYTFSGWTPAITSVTEGATYTAAWTLDTYTISYTLNGGTASPANPTSYTVVSAAITLNNPTRDGYEFVGWSGTDLTGGENLTVTIPTGSTGNKTYTANWKANAPSTPPDSSIVTAKTDISITINTQTGYDYSIDGTDWVSGTGSSYTFSGLSSGTPYNLVYRVAAVSTGDVSSASEASDPLPVTTKKSSAQVPVPDLPTIGTGADKPTSTSITVSMEEGNEYYISTSATPPTTWSTGDAAYATGTGMHTFSGLTPAIRYYVHVRVAETETAMPSASAYTPQYTLPATPSANVVTVNYAEEKINFANTYEVSSDQNFLDNSKAVVSGGTIQPETTYYVRVKADAGEVPASEADSFMVAARPATPNAITVADITKTDTVITIANTVSTQEYSVNGGTTWQTGNGGSLSFNDLTAYTEYSVVTRIPSTNASFASVPSDTLSVTTKTEPASLSDSGVTYSVKNGTIIGLGEIYEYSLDNGAHWQIAPVTSVPFAAGNVIQVRIKETDTAMPSQPQTLDSVASPAAAPAYAIDFADEKTTASVPDTVEYNTSSATATTWTTGENALLALLPGTNYYFRVAATDMALAGNVQTLTVPARPDAPGDAVITIVAGEDASHTSLTLAAIYEYILADALPAASEAGTAGGGSATEVAATSGQYVYVRQKAVASNSFASNWTDCGEVQLGVDSITLTGVGFDVAAGKLIGTTANMEYQVADGAWTICTAPDTSGIVFAAGTVKVRQTDKTTNEHELITIAAPASSNALTQGSKTYNSVTLAAMTGYEYSRDDGVTWQESNVFSGLSSSTTYSFVARIKATATTLPGTISTALAVTTDSAPSGGGTPPTSAPVIVDGKTQNIGTEKKSGDSTTVTVDQSKLGTNIGTAASGSSVVVPVSENGSATASLVVKNIEDMAQKGMTLTVQTGSVAYNLNTAAIDTAALAAAFPGADMSTVPFNVTITNSSVGVEGETLVLPPVAFTVTATYGGKTVDVDTFSAYIDRVIEVTKEQAAKITTAVVVSADGSVRHVPTNVIEKDGKYYAVVSSRTNSTYALIQNKVTFADAAGKWYEAAVNEMGSRKIIAGRSASAFDGDASITRAEFAAILIRALGLPTDGISAFSDVSASAWYSGAVATAAQYGIVSGKGDNQFDPNANITRQEAMLMLQRAAALTEFTGASGNLESFTDAASVGSWARDAAKWSIGSGLIQGSDGKLNPTANITRAESATIILRLLQKADLVDVRSEA